MSNPRLVKWEGLLFAVVGYGYDRSHPPGEFFECVLIQDFLKFLKAIPGESDTVMIPVEEAEEIEDKNTIEMLLVLYG